MLMSSPAPRRRVLAVEDDPAIRELMRMHLALAGLHVEALPDLGSKSGTLSRPVLFHYTAERAALQEIAGNVFMALRNQTIRVEVRHRYPLAAAAEAHRELEARRTTGSVVLLP